MHRGLAFHSVAHVQTCVANSGPKRTPGENTFLSLTFIFFAGLGKRHTLSSVGSLSLVVVFCDQTAIGIKVVL